MWNEWGAAGLFPRLHSPESLPMASRIKVAESAVFPIDSRSTAGRRAAA